MSVITIAAGDADVKYILPGAESDTAHDGQGIFYRQGVAWACLSKVIEEDADADGVQTLAPAMFKSTDGGLSWSGPLNQSTAPKTGRLYDNGSPYGVGDAGFVQNYDVRVDSTLNANGISKITVLMQNGGITSGELSGNLQYFYTDFDFETESWSAPYGWFEKPQPLDECITYSSGNGSDPVLAWTDASGTFTPHVDGASSIDGLGGYGSDNLQVGPNGIAYVIKSTNTPGDPSTGQTPPDGHFFQSSNLRFSGKYLYMASDAGDTFQLWSRDIEGGGWVSDPIPDADGFNYPWVATGCCGQVIVTYVGSDDTTIYRAIKAAGIQGDDPGAGWVIETVGSDALNPEYTRSCRNSVRVGFDVIYNLPIHALLGQYGGVFLLHTDEDPCATCNHPPAGEVGVEYSHSLLGCNGSPSPTFSITAGALPGGLTLDPSTGEISGTPTAAGTFDFTFALSGESVPTETADCSIVITGSEGALLASCGTDTDGVAGTAYSHTIPVSGGTAPYTLTITDGALPDGLTLDESTGVISGTPTATGTFTFSIEVTDDAAATRTVDCAISITDAPPALSLLCNDPPSGNAGTAYTHEMGAFGGTPPYTFSLVSGSLPDGLTLNTSTGVISGTPTATGTFDFTVHIADDADGSETAACEIVINDATPPPPGPPELDCNNPPAGDVGASYSHQLTVTSDGDYTIEISDGALPNGLSMSDSGLITGTPTVSGTYPFEITATNDGGATALSCSIFIDCTLDRRNYAF